MANYEKIVELRPEMGDFFHNRANIAFRGDVLTYGANVRTDSFTTDSMGFRHSTLNGRTLSVADCVQSRRYGIVLGSSIQFGFGVAGNENCMASLLADRFGFPFANAAMPGGNSRNLHSLLTGLIAGAGHPPAVVAHSSGGDVGNFCESGFADPIFGSPNRAQLKSVEKRPTDDEPDADRNFARLLAFTALWTSSLANLCRAHRTPLVSIQQSTFFEKSAPSPFERQAGLGEPFHASQARQFARHRKFDAAFYAKRKALADQLGIPLAGWGLSDQLSFIDEFHLDRDGTQLMSKTVGDTIEPLLSCAAKDQQASEL
jgi:hypothetical protein